MRANRLVGIALTALLTTTLPVAVTVLPAQAETGTPAYTKKTLSFDMVTGPDDDKHCKVVADLYKPEGVSRRKPAPAIITTNGFGGSKDDGAGVAADFAPRGYVVLSYSGLGFGGSGCRITLDAPEWDGKVVKQLVSFLGGSKAAVDGTTVDYVKRDRVDHVGVRHADDPRVGMFGGSYGGSVQFAAASLDKRIDAIAPTNTWNDLAFSVFPNHTDIDRGVSSDTPGVGKWDWGLGFLGYGVVSGLEHLMADPARLAGCPNWDPRVCTSVLPALVTGAPNDAAVSYLRHASVASYVDRIKVPTLLRQGLHDTLFNVNESVATYRALRANGVPTKLVWQSNGHSGGAVPGEGVVSGRYARQWFDHYLKGSLTKPRLDFSYFRDWVRYSKGARPDATPAYARSTTLDSAATRKRMYLSGNGTLVSRPDQVTPGTPQLLATAAGLPTSYTSFVASGVVGDVPLEDLPGTTTSFTSVPLAKHTDVVGVPTARLRLNSILHSVTTPLVGGATELSLFVRVEDIAPDGTRTLMQRRIAPIRVSHLDRDVNVQLPGLVHRFAKGHRIRLVIAGGDFAYRGNLVPGVVTVPIRPASVSSLELPVAAAAAQLPVR